MLQHKRKEICATFLAFVMVIVCTCSVSNLKRIYAEEGITSPVLGEKTTWQCIYMGCYPQTEVTNASNADAFAKLEKAASWTTDGTVSIDGTKYQRMKKSEVASQLNNTWTDDAYHYFKYEPIKWRVLSVNGKAAYVISDVVLDVQKYNEKAKTVEWTSSTVRSWLNSETADGFMAKAFLEKEKAGLVDTNGDKLSLLSEEECTAASGMQNAKGKIAKASDYAKARGCKGSKDGVCWWTKNNGNTTLTEKYVQENGEIFQKGYSVAYLGNGVRITARINLDQKDSYSYGGNVDSDGKVIEPITPATSSTEPTATVSASAIVEPSKTPVATTTNPIIVTDVTITPETTTNAPDVTIPNVTETPGVTITPNVTETPGVTITPNVTETSGVTITPNVTEISGVTITPNITEIPVVSKKPVATPKPVVKKGQKYTDKGTKAVYKVTKVGKNGTVEYCKSTSKNVTTAKIPATIKIKGGTYKVTTVASKAFANYKKLKSVTIGKNITKIGKSAFSSCTKLAKIKVYTKSLKTKSIGTSAFKKIKANAVINVPKGKVKTYKKLFVKAGIGKKVKVKV